jgi:hypothetical protein
MLVEPVVGVEQVAGNQSSSDTLFIDAGVDHLILARAEVEVLQRALLHVLMDDELQVCVVARVTFVMQLCCLHFELSVCGFVGMCVCVFVCKCVCVCMS